MPVLRLLGCRVVTSRSPKRIHPAVGSMNPAIIRSSVVFPQPDGPSRKNNSPALIVRSIESTATVPPKCLLKPLRVMDVIRLRIAEALGIGELAVRIACFPNSMKQPPHFRVQRPVEKTCFAEIRHDQAAGTDDRRDVGVHRGHCY